MPLWTAVHSDTHHGEVCRRMVCCGKNLGTVSGTAPKYFMPSEDAVAGDVSPCGCGMFPMLFAEKLMDETYFRINEAHFIDA